MIKYATLIEAAGAQAGVSDTDMDVELARRIDAAIAAVGSHG